MALSNVPVESTAILQMIYDYDQARETGSGQLIVTFKDGRDYSWPAFPIAELNTWTGSDSIGGYFNQYIRGQY